MKTIAVWFVVVMTMGVSICWGQTLRRAEDYYQRGLAREEKGDVEGAIADFSKAIEIYPKYSSAYGSRGAAKKAKGDIEGAVADFSQAIEINPDLALPYYNRGFIFLEKQHYDKAIRTLIKPSSYNRTWRLFMVIAGTLREPRAIFQEPCQTMVRSLESSRGTRRATIIAVVSDKLRVM